MSPDILVIELDARDAEFRGCGVPLMVSRSGPSWAIPLYEGLVLPNCEPRTPYGSIIRGWTGEWGGFDACRVCHDEQSQLDDVVTIGDLRDRSEGARLAAFIDGLAP